MQECSLFPHTLLFIFQRTSPKDIPMKTKFFKTSISLTAFVLTAIAAFAESDKATITVSPSTTRSIEGVSEVERERYFALADSGDNLDKRVQNESQFKLLAEDLGVRFGRSLGPVMAQTKWSKTVFEDPNRPGYADIDSMKNALAHKRGKPSQAMRAAYGDNLDIAAHGNHNAFPEFMGLWNTPDSLKHHHPESLPENIDAAAELSAAVLKYAYNDFNRPRYYEPVNEPHWSFYNTDQLADWHVETHRQVKELNPDVLVGGLCMPVSYFYKKNYRSFEGYRSFVENTNGVLDFYSFHSYDYFDSEDAGGNTSRVTGGLPLEGVLDLVSNHAVNTFGKTFPIVVSEHGGYVLNPERLPQDFDGAALAESLVESYEIELEDSFEGELQKRSLVLWMHLSTIVANTLTFMDHPHVVQKSVPFILFQSKGWDPKYYASAFVPKDYQADSEWKESFLLNFYRLFRGVEGRRVVLQNEDPDIQARAFATDTRVYTALNNLSKVEHHVSLNGLRGASHTIRRLGKAQSGVPYYQEDEFISIDNLVLAPRESVVIVSEYKQSIAQDTSVNERVFYGDRIVIKSEIDSDFRILVPEPSKVKYASLRVSVNRPVGTDRLVSVQLNGESLEVPIEDSAERFEDSKDGYASTKIIQIDPATLKRTNKIQVHFPDGKGGAVGSAVIRAGFEE